MTSDLAEGLVLHCLPCLVSWRADAKLATDRLCWSCGMPGRIGPLNNWGVINSAP